LCKILLNFTELKWLTSAVKSAMASTGLCIYTFICETFPRPCISGRKMHRIISCFF